MYIVSMKLKWYYASCSRDQADCAFFIIRGPSKIRDQPSKASFGTPLMCGVLHEWLLQNIFYNTRADWPKPPRGKTVHKREFSGKNNFKSTREICLKFGFSHQKISNKVECIINTFRWKKNICWNKNNLPHRDFLSSLANTQANVRTYTVIE